MLTKLDICKKRAMYHFVRRTRYTATSTILRIILLCITFIAVTSRYTRQSSRRSTRRNGNNADNIYSSYDLVQVQVDSDYSFTMLGNKSFPAVMSAFCPFSLFSPIGVMLAPESFPSLCGSIPSDTLMQFPSTFQYQDLQLPVAILVSAADHKDNCSIEEIVANVEQINMFSLGIYQIMYLIIPDSYRRVKNDTIQTSSWNVSDPCQYSYISSIFVEDDLSIEIEADVKWWQRKHEGESASDSSSQFVMTLTTDVDGDGKVTWQDYDAYYGVQDPSQSTTGNSSEQTTGFPTSRFKIWILLSFVGFCLVLCLLIGYYNQRGALQATEARLRESQSTTPLDGTSEEVGTGTRQDHQNEKKSVLTEDEFASLPQIPYREMKSSLNQETKLVKGEDVFVLPIMLTTGANRTDVQDEVIEPKDVGETDTMVTQQSNSPSLDDGDSNHLERTLITCQEILNETSQNLARSDCCSICLEEFQEEEIVTVLPRCLHLFHTKCIGEWLLVQKSETCPLCKSTILDKTENKGQRSTNNS